jgi:hypothetical protein
MDIEHCDFLSWFSRRGDGHEQDGETFRAAPRPASGISGDPAMAFEPSASEPARDFLLMTAPGSWFGSVLAAGDTTDE